MKKTFTKTLLALAVACFIFAIIPMIGNDLPDIGLDFTADAATVVASGTCGANLTWELDDEGTLTISGTGNMENYYADISAYPPWYSNSSSIKNLFIEDGVTSIGEFTFYFCASLTDITIPDSVTKIGSCAFNGTAYYNDANNWEANVLYIDKHLIKAKTDIFGTYAIKDGTKTIAESAFFRCPSLTLVTIPDSVTSIGGYAFYDCTALTSVTIGDSVTSIGFEAFYGCSSLTSVTIGDSVTSIGASAFYDTAYYKDANNWEDNVLYIGNHLIQAKTDLSGSYTIKGSTKTIAGSAFHNCTSLTSVTIPDSVTSISGWSFARCESLKKITIENPECEIFDSAETISDTAIIYGYTGSTAQAYAEKYDRTFVALEPAWIPGDIDNDGQITSGDARLALRASVGLETLTEQQTKAADVDYDGKITAGDARLILRRSVGLPDE